MIMFIFHSVLASNKIIHYMDEYKRRQVYRFKTCSVLKNNQLVQYFCKRKSDIHMCIQVECHQWSRNYYPSGTPEFAQWSLVRFVLLDLQFSVQCFVDRCLYFFFWSLCRLSLFYLRILITSLWYLQTLLLIKK